MLLPAALLLDPPMARPTMTEVAGYVWLSGAGALLAFALWFRGVTRLPAVAASSLSLLSPVTAVVLGWTLLGQSLHGLPLLGLVVVLGSIFVIQWSGARSARECAGAAR